MVLILAAIVPPWKMISWLLQALKWMLEEVSLFAKRGSHAAGCVIVRRDGSVFACVFEEAACAHSSEILRAGLEGIVRGNDDKDSSS